VFLGELVTTHLDLAKKSSTGRKAWVTPRKKVHSPSIGVDSQKGRIRQGHDRVPVREIRLLSRCREFFDPPREKKKFDLEMRDCCSCSGSVGVSESFSGVPIRSEGPRRRTHFVMAGKGVVRCKPSGISERKRKACRPTKERTERN